MIALAATVHAQKPMALIEEFTNWGCGPCASYSPTLESFINDRLGDVAVIKYHVSWPAPKDPFYVGQESAIDSRVSYYGLNSVPTVVINGHVAGQPNNAELTYTVDNFLGEEHKFALALTEEVLNGDSLTFTATVTPLADWTGNGLRLRVCPVEEEVVPAEPYPNGEEKAIFSMRAMLPGAEGWNPGNTLQANVPVSYTDGCSLKNFENTKEMGLVAFLQDDDTRDVLATAYISKGATHGDWITVCSLQDTPGETCVPDFHGNVIFRNDGANALTSADLCVKVNDDIKTYHWTGNLEYMERDTLSFDNFTEFTFAEGEDNTVDVWFENVNGKETTEEHSNTLSSTFKNSIQAEGAVQLTIFTDRKPEETTWQVLNSAGEVVQQGGPYDKARHTYTDTLHLSTDDCYTLEFLDGGGNGIYGPNGTGYCKLSQLNSDGTAKQLWKGYYEGSVFDLFFNLHHAAEPDGISSVKSDTDPKEEIYYLNGIKTEKPGKGVFIINGKKVLR